VVDQKPPGKADGDVLEGKHARVFTAAAAKRNPASPKIGSNPPSVALASPQFVDQAIKLGRGAHELRAQAVLQPLAHGVADRSAGLAIDLLACMGLKAGHGGFRRQSVQKLAISNSSALELFQVRGGLHGLWVKFA